MSGLAPLAGAGNGHPGFAVGGAAAFGFALVPELLAFRQRKFNFYPAIFEVQTGWNEGESLLLGLADKLPNLFLMDQEFAGAQRCVVEDVAVIVRSDVAVQQPQLAILEQAISVLEVSPAGADRFHFSSGQGDSGFELLQ